MKALKLPLLMIVLSLLIVGCEDEKENKLLNSTETPGETNPTDDDDEDLEIFKYEYIISNDSLDKVDLVIDGEWYKYYPEYTFGWGGTYSDTLVLNKEDKEITVQFYPILDQTFDDVSFQLKDLQTGEIAVSYYYPKGTGNWKESLNIKGFHIVFDGNTGAVLKSEDDVENNNIN